MKQAILPILALSIASASAAKRPNIVLIVADDMGYSDLGCYGGEIETPNLDALAAKGVRFKNYYVNNMCWPTRGSLMTGLYPKTALPNKGSASGGLHADSTTLPQALRAAGYTTLMAGKWHLSSSKDPDGPNAPHHRGYDHFYGTIDGASDFFAPVDLQLDGKSMTHEWENNPDYYYTDAIVDHALDFLNNAATENGEKPFFLNLNFTAAHWPLHARPKDIEHYKGRYEMGWDKLRELRHARMKEIGAVNSTWELSPRHPEVPAWADEKHREWQQRRMEVYAAQITCMDRNIGRIVDWVKKAEAFDDTIILYQHDNGGCHVEYGPKRTGSWTREFTTDGKNLPIKPGNIPGLMPGPQTTFQSYGYGWANASNTPFRMFKQYDHEGGSRSPLVVFWPNGIDPGLVGGWAPAVCHAIDMMPTLLNAAGVDGHEQKPFGFEGRSFLNELKGFHEKTRPGNPVFWAHSHGKAVRAGDWKLVSSDKGPWELYNVDVDGTELHDLAAKMPEKAAELAKLHRDWDARTDLGAKQPAPSKRNKAKKK